ncbi:uncharacterized protein [Musca autumnalis]|uniref:uncharacterized protein n=1 Tax=Musca autumnalis TaxID=221902 RepID=UPI003CEBDB3E
MFKAVVCKQFILLAYLFAIVLAAGDSSLVRKKRFLIFPQQAPTRHQFIGGIGIPADLDYESLTIGYVLKAMYWLPYDAIHFRENPYLPEYKDGFYNLNTSNYISNRSRRSTLRWDIYDILSERFDSYGYRGQECVMKAICEANALTFVRHYDVFGELMHILFSPSTSDDLEADLSQNYREAEKLGSSTGDCTIYDCNFSILELISKTLKIY